MFGIGRNEMEKRRTLVALNYYETSSIRAEKRALTLQLYVRNYTNKYAINCDYEKLHMMVHNLHVIFEMNWNYIIISCRNAMSFLYIEFIEA